MGQIGVPDAARRLGVSERVLRRRLARGDIRGETISGRWVLDQQEVDRARQRRAPAGRPLAPTTAWALLSTLSHVYAAAAPGRSSHVAPEAPSPLRDVLPDRRLRHRLSAFLRGRHGDERLAMDLRRRGRLSSHWIHPGVLPTLLRDRRVVVGGAHALAAMGADLSPGGKFRVYVRAADVADVVAQYHLESDPAGDLEILEIPAGVPDHDVPVHGGDPPVAAALVDLLEEPDARGRALARQWLQELIDSAFPPGAHPTHSASRHPRIDAP